MVLTCQVQSFFSHCSAYRNQPPLSVLESVCTIRASTACSFLVRAVSPSAGRKLLSSSFSLLSDLPSAGRVDIARSSPCKPSARPQPCEVLRTVFSLNPKPSTLDPLPEKCGTHSWIPKPQTRNPKLPNPKLPNPKLPNSKTRKP